MLLGLFTATVLTANVSEGETRSANPTSGDIELDVMSLPDLSWIPDIDLYNTPVRVDGVHGNENKSESCLRDLLYTVKQMKVEKGHPLPDWFVSMVDSVGKIPSGITTGALSWPGYFRQCLEVQNERFSGRYCSVNWSVVMQNGSLIAPLTQGICVPSSCSSDDILNHIHVLSDVFLKIPTIKRLTTNRTSLQGVYCHPLPEERHLDAAAVATLSVLIIICSLSIVATTADYLFLRRKKTHTYEVQTDVCSSDDPLFSSNEDDGIVLTSTSSGSSEPSGGPIVIFRRLLTSFSLISNMRRLFSTGQSHERELPCVNGIRAMSMTWVILCHSFLFSLLVTNNLLHVLQDADSLIFFVIINGSFCVDTFFVLGGLLLSYHWFSPHAASTTSETGSQVTSHPVFSIIVTVIKRLYRLLPLYFVVLAFDANLTHYGASGPYWDYGDQKTSEKTLCNKSGWYNVLFINNFLPIRDQCMAWTWYLADDMQFFLLSLIILILVKR